MNYFSISHIVLAAACAFTLISCGSSAKSDPANPGNSAERDPREIACGTDNNTLEADAKEAPQSAPTPPQMVATSKKLLEHMDQLLVRLRAARNVARPRNDVIRLGCVNDRLLESKELLNVAERAHTYLVDAIAADENEERDRQYAEITGAYQSMWILSEEATDCACTDLEN